MGTAIGAIMGSSNAILLGRQTYQEFYPAWSTRTPEEDPGAPFMNDSPKYVVSSTMQDAPWNNSTIIRGYDGAAIRDVKERTDGNIYVSGSGTLARAMLADGLVDELHLFVFPLVLGSGKRLFTEGGPSVKLTSSSVESYSSGVVHLAYQRAQ
jgi:dihydrofolate reductase